MKAYERLLKYVKIYTTSDEESKTVPSTSRQFDLAKILVKEMKDIGIEDVKVDEDIKKMSVEQRKLTAIELYTNAVASYKKYLLKSKDAKDSEDINNQIKSIEEELSKLGNE